MKWRSPITMLVLLALLFGAAYYGWRTVLAPVPAESAATTTPTASPTPEKKPCYYTHIFKKGEKFKRKDIKVNVYNAGDITNAASNAMATLVKRGFRKGKVANAPSGTTASDVVLYGAKQQSPKVQLVRQQFPGKVPLRESPNPGVGIDVVIGNDYEGLATKAPKSITVPKRTRVCLRAG